MAVVPALAVIYALGIIVTTGSALFSKWLQHPTSQEKAKDALAVMAATKNDLLNQKFSEIIRSWKTLEGMFIPLLFLLGGIVRESFRYSNLDSYLRYAGLLVVVLLVLCPLFAWLLAKSVDEVLDAALDGAGANLSISIECDRSPIARGVDALRVNIKLIKGDRGSVDLRDARGQPHPGRQRAPGARYHRSKNGSRC
jgi:hypothetical protein